MLTSYLLSLVQVLLHNRKTAQLPLSQTLRQVVRRNRRRERADGWLLSCSISYIRNYFNFTTHLVRWCYVFGDDRTNTVSFC